MKILGLDISLSKKSKDIVEVNQVEEPQSRGNYNTGYSRVIHYQRYDGEKNLGEIGPVTDYALDYESLRLRSWKAYLDSEIAQSVVKKYVKWVIGSGLKLQCEPVLRVLRQEGYDINKEEFSNEVEARFKVYSKSKMSCFNNEMTLHKIMNTAYLNAVVGGDALVVLRVIKGDLKIQLYDGGCLASNMNINDKIVNGVEYDDNGSVVAYHLVKKGNILKTERIKAYNGGFRVAFLFKGLTYRMHNNRGIPLISTVLEVISKLDRYKEATVGSAEELNKLVYQIVHQSYSSGENPASALLTKAFDVGDNAGQNIPVDEQGRELANNIAVSTNKQAFNNPVGAEIKPVTGGTKELYFRDFMTINIELVCAALAIPPEVAMSKYDSNFSASRAALKDWEHTINVERSFFQEEFMQHIYDFWLYIEVLKGKIRVNGLLKAVQSGNQYAMNAFTQSRFVGANVPHIDPLKEVKAEREKLGSSGKHIPLTTVEQATETLNGGDSVSNIEQYSDELRMTNELDIPTTQEEKAENSNDNSDDEEGEEEEN